jgi:membrane protease YdiL (CAAX protease family)
MEPEVQPPASEVLLAETAIETPIAASPEPDTPDPWETRAIRWMFLGSQGLRAGWSTLIFMVLFLLFASGVGYTFVHFHLVNAKSTTFTASSAFFGELISFLAVAGAAALVALIERRRNNLLAYNLTGPRRLPYFLQGLVAGVAGLSALIGLLAWGGWLHFGPIALSGAYIFKYAALWGAAFLLVGFVEEGIFRCFLQFTFTRGLNFWWALGLIALICGGLLLRSKGNGVWGVYIVALAGLVPCLLLQLRKAEGAGFWQAAWVTTTMFGFVHTGNGGENWVGIFAAAAVGFVFCVSVRVTGSAWWAIGCHTAWDWAETYLYGAADSGNVATGHYLTTSPAGNALWSGGTDGPEGSVLVLAILILFLVALLLIYGRGKPRTLLASNPEPAAG